MKKAQVLGRMWMYSQFRYLDWCIIIQYIDLETWWCLENLWLKFVITCVDISLVGVGVTCYEETWNSGEDPSETEQQIHHNWSYKHSAALLPVVTQGPEGETGSWLGTYEDRGDREPTVEARSRQIARRATWSLHWQESRLSQTRTNTYSHSKWSLTG